MANKEIGNILKGQVTGIKEYGAFVCFEDGRTGLIHISEISNDFVKDISSFLQVGEQLYCQVLNTNDETGQLKLSIKNINYKVNEDSKIKESRLGFLPLRNQLDKWIEKRVSEIKKN